MAQQTAVEWLVNQLKIRGYAGEFPPHLLFEHAKQMEKEQISQGYMAGLIDGMNQQPRDYYNQTYTKSLNK